MIKTYLHMAVVVVVGLLIAVWTMAPAFADHKENHVVCPDGDGWEKTDVDTESPTLEYKAPEGFLLSESCVKAGSDQSTDGNPLNTIVYDPPVSETVLGTATQKGMSHYSVKLVPAPTVPETPEPTLEPEYTPPVASLELEECGVLRVTVTDVFEEDFIALRSPDGKDVFGGAKIVDADESFIVELNVAGEYALYSSPRFPVGVEFVLQDTITVDDVECDPVEEEVLVTETKVEELPNTGPEDAGLIALVGMCLLGAGTWITRKYGWMN